MIFAVTNITLKHCHWPFFHRESRPQIGRCQYTIVGEDGGQDGVACPCTPPSCANREEEGPGVKWRGSVGGARGGVPSCASLPHEWERGQPPPSPSACTGAACLACSHVPHPHIQGGHTLMCPPPPHKWGMEGPGVVCPCAPPLHANREGGRGCTVYGVTSIVSSWRRGFGVEVKLKGLASQKGSGRDRRWQDVARQWRAGVQS
ncbi:hypothetical protein H4582DRAFT_2061153 [Lactarius indigo]|nr:hypothetical protein H4582DRAFT_2061153 [Lactarius indigo]